VNYKLAGKLLIYTCDNKPIYVSAVIGRMVLAVQSFIHTFVLNTTHSTFTASYDIVL